MIFNLTVWLWQLPQHLLGLFLIKILKAEKIEIIDLPIYWAANWNAGISLGIYIILRHGERKNTILHEYGHSIQSMYLGPLYLLLVGIPSALFCNLWDRVFHRKWDTRDRIVWYHSRYPENWANRLGGVEYV